MSAPPERDWWRRRALPPGPLTPIPHSVYHHSRRTGPSYIRRPAAGATGWSPARPVGAQDEENAMALDADKQAEIDVLRESQAPTRRATVPALEALLYEPIPVLDHGFIRVIDYMGDDAAIVQAAQGVLRSRYQAGQRRPGPDQLSDAAPPHEPVRDVRAQAAREAADLRGAGSGSVTAPPTSTNIRRATRCSIASSTSRTRTC